MDKVYVVKYIPTGRNEVLVDESRFYRSFQKAFGAIVEDYMQIIRNYPNMDMEVDKEHGRVRLYENGNIIERAYVSTVEVI